MKRHGLLHAELNRIVAAMGHTDTLVIADVGLPVPSGVTCIDLAVVGGLPSFLAVFEAVFAELCVERVTFAREVQQANPSVATLAAGLISRNTVVDEVSHEEFKRLCASAVAVVRTGETSPYANAILHAGVTFLNIAGPLIRMQGITKAFGPVKVLEGVQFELLAGEVHALMGENGAGKSTLMKILTGIHAPDQGSIVIDGVPVAIGSPADAEHHGIAIIHQELNLIPGLSIAANLFLGREIARFGMLDGKAMRKRAAEWLARVGMSSLHPDTVVERLSVGQQQMVEIARALGQDARVLIMDEPTAALTERETAVLFDLIRQLRAQGKGIVYVSHRMEEIFAVCDRISVLRDGQFVGTRDIDGLNLDDVVKMMVGRSLEARFPSRTPAIGAVRLQVEGIGDAVVHDVSFDLHAGEVLGVAGLMGAGRTELARLLFGLEKPSSGRVLLDGAPLTATTPRQAIAAGFGFVTEDRKAQGLVMGMSLRENVSLPNVPAHAGLVDRGAEKKQTRGLMDSLRIRARDMEIDIHALSGGNQQKVVLAKWLALKPRVLILDEPTRGVDIGGKAEIYTIINQLAEQGVAILMISSELPEVLAMSDRILVMHEGRAAALLDAATAAQETVMHAATGGQ